MLANEKEFDKNLEQIGKLYEEGKDCLSSLMIHHPPDIRSQSRLYEILREMRDISAVQLKANHEIKDN
jgi:hypothetical protein